MNVSKKFSCRPARAILPFLRLLPASLLWVSSLDAGTITGRVTDLNSDASLENVKVSVEGSNIRAYTDRSGTYVLKNVPEGAQTVHFDFLGYDSVARNIPVNSEKVIRDIKMGGEVITLDAFVVEGRALGQARALNQQKAAVSLVNIVASDAIGMFPDENAAESLQRLPGISLERDQGEGRFVVVRGIDPDLNSTMVNGMLLPATEAETRKVNLDVMPNDGISSIEVSKVLTPDMPADSIGGNINIKTLSAFDNEGRTIRLSAETQYADLIDDLGYKVKGSYSDIYNDGTLGMATSFSYQDRTMGTDGAEVDGGWTLEEGPDGEEYYVPAEIEFREYIVKRVRWGLTNALEYKPNENSMFYVRTMYNEFHDTENRYRVELKTGDGDGIFDTDDVPEAYLGEGEGIVGVQKTDIDIKSRKQSSKMFSVVVGGEQSIDNWNLDYALSYGYSTEYEHDRMNAAFRLDDEDGDGNDVISVIHYKFDDVTSYPTIEYLADQSTELSDIYNPANYQLDEVEYEDNESEEKVYQAVFNARYQLDENTFIKTGFSLRERDKDSDANNWVYSNPEDYYNEDNSRNPASLGLDQFARFSDRYSYWSGPSLDSTTFNTFFHNDVGSGKGTISYLGDGQWEVDAPGGSYFEFEDEDTLIASLENDYTAKENIYSYYLMGERQWGAFSLLGGARIEYTDFKSTGYEVSYFTSDDEDAGLGDEGDLKAINPISYSKDYTNVLPGIHARYDWNDNLVLRSSYSQSLARPKPGDSAYRREVNEDGEVEQGNPALDPYFAHNFDFSVEYYMDELGMLSATVFHKQINDFIYMFEDTDPITGEDRLMPQNGDDAEITGLELVYSQRFGFLPGFLNGFGTQLNATFVDSDAVYGDGVSRPFLKQSDTLYNVALTYEKYGFFFRLAGTYRSEYYDVIASDVDEDEVIDARWQWDLTTDYKVSDHMKIYAEFLNITNEPFESHYGNNIGLRQVETYGWRANVGVKYTY
ncbi:MAG: TonB-dependent receptor [Opitutales bacterium]|nr:TonB-dependent receptor [Opitutales bacterium]